MKSRIYSPAILLAFSIDLAIMSGICQNYCDLFSRSVIDNKNLICTIVEVGVIMAELNYTISFE